MEFTSCLQETEVSVDEHCCLSCFLKRKKGIGSFSTSLCFFRSRWRFCSGWMGGMKAGKERTIQLYSQGVNRQHLDPYRMRIWNPASAGFTFPKK